MGLHSLGDGSRVRFPLTEDEEPCLSVTEVLILVIAGQFLLEIKKVTGTVQESGLMLECSQLCTPALIIVSVNGRTWLWTLSLATTRIILLRTITAAEPAALRARGEPTSLDR